METIVIQEPDESVRDVLKLAFEAEGFNVYALDRCGPRLLSLIRKANPSLVLLDFRISGEECIKMLRIIKQSFARLPVIAMSCNNKIKHIYHNLGFDGYLEKPFDLNMLSQVAWGCLHNNNKTADQ